MLEALLIVHLLIAAAMVAIVLLQKSEGGALGIGGGGGAGGFLSGRGTDNLLTRMTALLAGLFFLTSIALSVVPNFSRQDGPSRFDTPTAGGERQPGQAGTTAPKPAGGGVLDKLKAGQGDQRLPSIPQSQ